MKDIYRIVVVLMLVLIHVELMVANKHLNQLQINNVNNVEIRRSY